MEISQLVQELCAKGLSWEVLYPVNTQNSAGELGEKGLESKESKSGRFSIAKILL